MVRHQKEVTLVLIFTLFGVCFGIFGKPSAPIPAVPQESEPARERREPIPMIPPFAGFQGIQGPMMQGNSAFRPRGYGPPQPEGEEKEAYDQAYVDQAPAESNDANYTATNIYESEYYEPSYCEVVLIEELTRAVKYLIAYDYEVKYNKIKRRRYATKVTSIIPQALFEALYKGTDIVDTVTKALEVEYNLIPETNPEKTKQFVEKAKHAVTDILNLICKFNYCCLKASSATTTVEYAPQQQVYY